MISQDKVRYLHFTKIRDTTYLLVWLAMLAVSSLEAAAAVPKHDDIFVTIAEGGKAKCVIVVGDKATSEEKRAASQIQDVLLRDGGEMPRLLTARNRASLSSDLPLIVIGTLQTNPLVSVIAPDAKNEGESLSLEGFRILTTMYRPGTGSARTRTILIWSKTARGVLYGATEFTDYVMRPDAERRVRVGHTNLRRNPHFSIRGTYNLSCW